MYIKIAHRLILQLLFDFIGNFLSLKGDFCHFILKNIIKYKVCTAG